MTEKKTTPRKRNTTTKKPVKKAVETIELIDEVDEKLSTEDLPTVEYVDTTPVQEKFEENEPTNEPIITISEVLPKEYAINYKKISTVKDIVLLLKGLGLKTLKIHDSDIDEFVKELITKKHIKAV